MNTYWERLLQVLLDIFTHNLSYGQFSFCVKCFRSLGRCTFWRITSSLEFCMLPTTCDREIFFFNSWGVTKNSTPLKNAPSCFKSSYDHWTILEVYTLKEIRLRLKESRLIIPSTWNCIFLHYECCLISDKLSRSLVSLIQIPDQDTFPEQFLSAQFTPMALHIIKPTNWETIPSDLKYTSNLWSPPHAQCCCMGSGLLHYPLRLL